MRLHEFEFWRGGGNATQGNGVRAVPGAAEAGNRSHLNQSCQFLPLKLIFIRLIYWNVTISTVIRTGSGGPFTRGHVAKRN